MKHAVPLYTLTRAMNDLLWMHTHSVNQEKRDINLKYSECDHIDGQVGNYMFLGNFLVFVNLWRHGCLVVDWVDPAIDWHPIQGRVAIILLVSSCTFLINFIQEVHTFHQRDLK